MRSVVFVSATNGYFFYIDSGGSTVYSKTTNGGATWGAAVLVGSTTDVAFDVWYDQWTPGDSGTKIAVWTFGTGNDTIICDIMDTTTDTWVGGGPVFSGASAVAGRGAFCSGTKTRSGYYYCAFDIDAGAERGLVRSTDGGTTWSANLDVNFVEATIDQCLLFPATGTGDNNDMIAIYHDASADQLSKKGWDSSTGVQATETNLTGCIENTIDLTGQMGFWAAVRHSDGHLILASFSDRDTATSSLEMTDLLGDFSGFPTFLTGITFNIDDIYHPAVFIDQNTNAIYVAYNGKRDGSEVLGTTTKIYYTKSTDGGTTWTSGNTAYQEGAAAAAFQVWAPISGPRFYVGWRVGTTLVGNAVNSVDVTPVVAVTPLPELIMQPMTPARTR